MIRKFKRYMLKNNPKWFQLIRNIYLKTIYVFPVKGYRTRMQAERYVSFGKENPDKTFYVIRRQDEKCGLFSWLGVIVGHLARAEENGWIPIVDMKTYPSPFVEENEIGRINAWEFYFKQPCGYTLEDIQKSKNVILSYMYTVKDGPNSAIYYDMEKRKEWVRLTKKYIIFNDEIQKDIDKMQEKLLGQENVLGLLCRGTDYINLRPSGHEIQPTIEQIINQVKKSIKEINATKIYLCTEDLSIIEALTKEFKEKVVVYPREYVDYKGGFIFSDNIDRKISKRQLTYDYLMQIAVLSKTNSIVAGRCGGACGALLFSGEFSYEFFWDLGRYI